MSRRVRRRQRKQPHTLQIFLTIVLVLLTVCVLVKAFFLKAPEQKAAELPAQPAASDTDDSQQSQEEQAAQEALRSHLERKGGFYTILASGVDDGNGGSDTNILVAVDTKTGYVYGVSIPRDSKAIIDGKARKINYAYNKGGTKLLADTVSEQLGIPVDYTVCVNLKGFTALVDAIGGVDFDVPINM
ncbi:MAG: LytR family transcriptional regulator, partial [Clostridiales bacterium]|nr:LytR family transcriptional regulator [Clostridiales bacterium]